METFASFEEADRAERADGWARTPAERLATLERLRRQANPMADLDPIFREWLERLNSRRVAYLLVGGYAVAAHGFVRYAADIDVRVRRPPENAARVVAAAVDFGLAAADPSPELFLDPGRMARFGVPPLKI